MGSIVLLLWYALMLAVWLGPAAWFLTRWDRRAVAAMARGEGKPALSLPERLGRLAIVLAALAIPYPIVATMHNATPSLQIALGLGHMVQ